jgi:hypothetical protein
VLSNTPFAAFESADDRTGITDHCSADLSSAGDSAVLAKIVSQLSP